MKIVHLSGGTLCCLAGLFLSWLNLDQVIAFIKGSMQPVTILAGIAALIAALIGNRKFRTVNSVIAGFLLFMGGYGLYDEYYAVIDFFYGFFPVFFICTGTLSLVAGVKKLKGSVTEKTDDEVNKNDG